MKYIKKFENFDNNSNSTKVNEEFVGLGVLALGGLALAGAAIYTGAKRIWSKHVTGLKYELTGNKEEVINKETTKKEIISEYKDKEGKLYWGYDHKYNPDAQMGDSPSKDIYTAIFNESDLDRLKKYLNGIKVKTFAGIGAVHDYLDKPKVVDMIYKSSLVDPDEGNY